MSLSMLLCWMKWRVRLEDLEINIFRDTDRVSQLLLYVNLIGALFIVDLEVKHELRQNI